MAYQAWTASFDGAAGTLNSGGQRRSGALFEQAAALGAVSVPLLARSFHANRAALGTSLPIIGVFLHRPNLSDLSLLLEPTSRTCAELFWRVASLKTTPAAILFPGDFQGLPTFNLGALADKVTALVSTYKTPRWLTHGGVNLGDCFQDPMYLPEDYERVY